RRDELPATIAKLEAGGLSVDQAAEVARYVPARYDASAARVADTCTVRQLRKALPWYRDEKETKAKPGDDPGPVRDPEGDTSVSKGYDERGFFAYIRLPESTGAIVDQALDTMLDDLKRQAKADAPDGTDPEPVSMADALVALAETALQAAEAARPGTDRYLVHVHLEAGPAGIELATRFGIPLPDGQRRHILCDAKLKGLVRDGASPLSAGRTTRDIPRRVRRAIEHRDRHCCSVPGCGRTHGLEIHHIVHWEDGGPTDTWNLILLCRYHHTVHHQGTLGISGNADLPRHHAPGVVFTNAWGHALDPTGSPVRPAPRPADTAPHDHIAATARAAGIAPGCYLHPTGERLDPWGFHLRPDQPDWSDSHRIGEQPPDDGDDDEPPPEATGERPSNAAPDPTAPRGDAPIDPTRAGPDAA
ncbi:MAG: DUF222 domain-containing protein, partial [Aquihabitans sp.]